MIKNIGIYLRNIYKSIFKIIYINSSDDLNYVSISLIVKNSYYNPSILIMLTTQQEIGLLVLGVYNLIVYLLFLGFYVKRVNKLDKLASSHIQQNRRLKVRVVAIICLVFLEFLHIILSYCDPSYFMYEKRNYSLIDVLCMFDLILQIYIITREHIKKTRRSKTVVLLWILMILEYTVAIIIVQVFAPNSGIVLLILQLILCVFLIVVTYMNEPNELVSLQSFRQSNVQSNFFPNSQTASKSSKNNQRIFVQFNKQFQVSLMKDYYECAFKIAVYICDKYHIITRSETQFIKLSKDMVELFPNSEQVKLGSVIRAKNCSNIMKYGEQKQKIYESYLINLTNSDQFYAEPLMNFLQIHSQKRNILKKAKGALLKRETILTTSQQKLKKPFFSVLWRDNKILVSNPQIMQFYVNKQINEIILFHNRLVSQKKLKMELISQQFDKGQLCHFIQRMVNSKYYWPYFVEWMCLGSAIEEKVLRMFDFWVYGFENLEMSIIGYQTHFDKNNSVVYYYLLSIQNKNTTKQTNQFQILSLNPSNNAYNSNSTPKQGIMLKKRYNDFVKLNDYIKKFVATQNIKNARIPQLPPKFSPFDSKTSPNSRRVYFDTYIKQIIKIEGINHCIKLLQFFEIDSESVYELIQLKKEQSNSPLVNNEDMVQNNGNEVDILDQTHLDNLGV